LDILPQVRETIKRFGMLTPGDAVVVGVSGGPDSVALLDLLSRLRDELGLRLHVAHLNHRLRPEAAEEAEFVRRLASGYGLPVTVDAADVPAYAGERRLSTEMAARELRYAFFTRVLSAVGAAKVALGHQADDQAETVLMNLLRGTGLAGLKGIPPVRGPFVRPLIEVRRAAIEAYCASRGLKTCYDASNIQTAYRRNKIRHELLPLLEREYNPALVPALGRLAAVLREEEEFLAAEAAKVYAGLRSVTVAGVYFDGAAISTLPRAMARRVVRLAYREVAGSVYDLDFRHTEEVLRLLERATGREVILPRGVKAVRIHGRLLFRTGAVPAVPDFCYPLPVPGVAVIREIGVAVKAELVASGRDPATLPPQEALLDYERVRPPLFVRRRRAGDLFYPLGHPAPVRLKSFFINQKIPRYHRDRIPLVVDATGILWVAGVRPAEPVRVTSQTRRCLHLELIPLEKNDL